MRDIVYSKVIYFLSLRKSKLPMVERVNTLEMIQKKSQK